MFVVGTASFQAKAEVMSRGVDLGGRGKPVPPRKFGVEDTNIHVS